MKATENGKMRSLQRKFQLAWEWNGRGAGQFFDKNTYVGCVRSIALMGIFIYVGWNADGLGRWLFNLFGETLIVSPGQVAWHRMVAVGIGMTAICFDIINIYNVYNERKKSVLSSRPKK